MIKLKTLSPLHNSKYLNHSDFIFSTTKVNVAKKKDLHITHITTFTYSLIHSLEKLRHFRIFNQRENFFLVFA